MKRVIVVVKVIMVILIAYTAVYLGNGLNHSYRGPPAVSSFFIVVFGVALFAIGILFCFRGTPEAFYVAFILFSALFGLFSAPFDQGPYPWQWVNMWIIIPVVTIIPVVLSLFAPIQAESDNRFRGENGFKGDC